MISMRMPSRKLLCVSIYIYIYIHTHTHTILICDEIKGIKNAYILDMKSTRKKLKIFEPIFIVLHTNYKSKSCVHNVHVKFHILMQN